MSRATSGNDAHGLICPSESGHGDLLEEQIRAFVEVFKNSDRTGLGDDVNAAYFRHLDEWGPISATAMAFARILHA